MNTIKKLSAATLMILCLASCKDTANEPTEANAAPVENTETKIIAENVETATFKIEGMTCAIGCAKVIESKLAGMDGVQNAEVDYENKTATVSFDNAQQTPEAFVETVESIAEGAYTVSEVKNSGDKAQLYTTDQEPEKKNKKKKKKATAKEGKKGCCGGKTCGSSPKKANT